MVWASKEIDFYKSFRGRCFLTVCWNHLGNRTVTAILQELGVSVQPAMVEAISSLHSQDVKNKERWNSEKVRRRWAQRKKERTERRATERSHSKSRNEAYNFEHTLFEKDELDGQGGKKAIKKPRWGTKSGARWKCETCNNEYAPGTSKAKHKLSCGKGRLKPRPRR